MTQKPTASTVPDETSTKSEPADSEKPTSTPSTDSITSAPSQAASPSTGTNWLVIVVIFLALLAGAIYLGLNAEHQYGDAIFQKLPAAVTDKLVKPASPAPEPIASPMIQKPQLAPSPTAEPEESPPSDRGADESAYILPFSDARKITTADLRNLSDWELKVARNEIFARHGRPFVHKDLECYFAKQSWYKLDAEFSTDSLSALETSNAVFIQNYEKEVDSELINKDTGCKSAW